MVVFRVIARLTSFVCEIFRLSHLISTLLLECKQNPTTTQQPFTRDLPPFPSQSQSQSQSSTQTSHHHN